MLFFFCLLVYSGAYLVAFGCFGFFWDLSSPKNAAAACCQKIDATCRKKQMKTNTNHYGQPPFLIGGFIRFMVPLDPTMTEDPNLTWEGLHVTLFNSGGSSGGQLVASSAELMGPRS